VPHRRAQRVGLDDRCSFLPELSLACESNLIDDALALGPRRAPIGVCGPELFERCAGWRRGLVAVPSAVLMVLAIGGDGNEGALSTFERV